MVFMVLVFIDGNGSAHGGTHAGPDHGTLLITQLFADDGPDRTADTAADGGFELVIVRIGHGTAHGESHEKKIAILHIDLPQQFRLSLGPDQRENVTARTVASIHRSDVLRNRLQASTDRVCWIGRFLE
jgi:hypothetical protein